MKARLLQMLNRLEELSLRERGMVVLGLPLMLVVAAEPLVFSPARELAAQAAKEAEQKQAELQSLQAVIAAQPVAAPLPAADQLRNERNELQARIDEARAVMASLDQAVAWGSILRATVSGAPGLTLTQLKTLPPELVFNASMVRPANPSASAGGAGKAVPAVASAQQAAVLQDVAEVGSVYRHRAELTLQGDFAQVLGYVLTLQRTPGELLWERLQLNVAKYPQVGLQVTLYTLSSRAETPFN
jgi:MSHA biogenesis protein MshJ